MIILIKELPKGKFQITSSDELVNGMIQRLNPQEKLSSLGVAAIIKILFDNTFVSGEENEKFRKQVEEKIHAIK